MKKTVLTGIAFSLAVALCVGICPAYAEGTVPVAENLELKTYQNVSVGGSLNAYDPDGGALEYTVTTEPVKGSIELGEGGSFVYTPRENKKGRDYFGYKATDAEGNVSQEATVIIRIEKAKKDVLYSDMRGRAEEYAAVALAENGIFTAEQVGGKYCFSPDKSVSRGEFISMCMLVSDKPVPEAALTTNYSDDEQIPAWMKGYVTAAAMFGIAPHDPGAQLDADAPITQSEAAVILDRALNVTSVSYIPLDSADDMPAAQACANLTACGVMDSSDVGAYLTRGAMAQLLYGAIELMAKR